jgi:hypothetical protein
MNKAIQFANMSNELMAKAHHECYNIVQKLVVEARADMQAANERRRRPRNIEGTSVVGTFVFVSNLFIFCSVFILLFLMSHKLFYPGFPGLEDEDDVAGDHEDDLEDDQFVLG